MSGKHIKKQEKKLRPEKRNLLPVILIGVIIIFIAGVLLAWLDRDSAFEKAVRNPLLREAYIDRAISETEKPENISVIYVNTEEKLMMAEEAFGGKISETFMRLKPSRPIVDWGKMPIYFDLYIFPITFERREIRTNEDFKSVLAHEYRHAEVGQSGKIGEFSLPELAKKISEQKLMDAIAELDALQTQIKRKDKLSSHFWMIRRNQYLSYYADLWNYSERLGKSTAHDLKAYFFEPSILLMSAREIQEVAESKGTFVLTRPDGIVLEITPDIYGNKLAPG